MSNQTAMVPLFLMWQSLVPQNCSGINFNFTFIQAPSKFPKPTIDLPSGYTVFPDIGAAYKVYRTPRTWGQGKKYCNGEGANLAIIDSLQKVQYVKDLKGSDEFDVHVGMHRFFDENEWDEIRTGFPPVSIPWRSNSMIEDKTRKCSVIDWPGNGVVASDCQALFYFVCEIPI